MSSWMHFIGKAYYTIEQFIEEAQRHGITRRLSLIAASGMTWGDTVTCVRKEGKNKSYSVFLEFKITRLVGISEQARVLASEDFAMEQVGDEEEEVERECGSYTTQGTYEVDASLADFTKKLRKLKGQGVDTGNVMVGCFPEDIELVSKPFPKIGGFQQNRGFRSYNSEKFWKDVCMGKLTGRKRPYLGTYYITSKAGDDAGGIVQPVKGYRRIEEMEKEEKSKALLVGQLTLFQ